MAATTGIADGLAKREAIATKLMANPDFYDIQIALLEAEWEGYQRGLEEMANVAKEVINE
jgi:hypothetical protein